jgi:hypothetical protein
MMSVVWGRAEVIADLQENRADQVPLRQAADKSVAELLLDP